MTVWRENLKQLGARTLPAGAGFWAWWRRSLLAWLPLRWQVLLGVSDARLLLSAQADTLHLARIMHGQREALGSLPLPAPALDAFVGPRLSLLPRHGLLASAAALRRRLLLPAAAQPRLRDVVGFEIDRQTPFNAGQVHYDVRVLAHRDDGQLEVELVVVPRPQVEALLRSLGAEVGLEGVDVAGDDGLPLGVNLLPPAQQRQRGNPMQSWNTVLLVACVLVLVAAAWQLLDNRRQAAATLRASVDAQAVQARAVSAQRQQLQDLVEGAAFFQEKQSTQPPVTAVWNELSLRLPDGTWLERLALEGRQLQLMGFSNSASSLVARLEGASLWQSPALTGVLQADDSRRRDRFTLTADLQRSPKEAADGAATRSP